MKYLNNKKGFSVILVPIILSLILAFVALVIDFGRVLILKHQLQSVADATSIAGASMVKVEFVVDKDGNYDFNNTNVNIVEDKAYDEADYYFNKNMEALQLEEKGVNILDNNGSIEDNVFQYNITANIPIFLGASFLGINNPQEITVVSQSETVQ